MVSRRSHLRKAEARGAREHWGAIRVKNGVIGTGKIHAVGMISQRLVAHFARHSATVLINHQEPNAVLF
jgi:hypothetical protein